MLPEQWFDEERASSETHPPLFLGISFYVTNTTTEEITEDVPMNSLPTCLGKHCIVCECILACTASSFM